MPISTGGPAASVQSRKFRPDLRPYAATSAALVWDWGYNGQGELGNGTISDSSVPVQVSNLTSVQTQVSASYTYNADGLRMSKTVNGVTSQYTWNVSGGLPLLPSDGSVSYIYGPRGLPVEQIDASGNATYYYQGQLGSTRMLVNQAGSVVATSSYDPYGNLVSHTGSATTPFGFAGQYTDSETGLVYLRARYYDPGTGQFLSVDPLVSVTRATYGYAADNPIASTDPSGQWLGWDTALGAAIGGIVGTAFGSGGYLLGAATGQQQFSWRGLAGATTGGLVGGTIGGACIGTTWIAIAGCGAAAGAAGTFTNEVVSGQPVTLTSVLEGAGVGAIGNIAAVKLFPLRGFSPRKLRNIWNPGINSLRLYGRGAVSGAAGMAQGLLQGFASQLARLGWAC